MTRRKRLNPDLSLLRGVVSNKLLDAAQTASDALTRAGVRHALIGGLAVGAYGYVRATNDIDFLVGEEAFIEHGGGVVSHKPGVPFEVAGYLVDVFDDAAIEKDELGTSLSKSSSMLVVSVEGLVYLKLRAFRRRDKEDIIQLVREGVDVGSVEEYIEDLALPHEKDKLLGRLRELVTLADAKE